MHEIAQGARPGARVVYVDYDPVVCVHGRALLSGSDGVRVVQADARRPAEIVENPDVRHLIDFDRPVAVGPRQLPGPHARHRRSMASRPQQETRTVLDTYSTSTAPLTSRSRDEVLALFEGFDLVDPGLTWLVSWGADQPVENPERSLTYVGVGRKS